MASSSSLAATTSGRQARINTTIGKGSEELLKRQATSNILDYEQVKTIEQLLDQQSIVVAETQLVALIDKPTSRYSLQIVELRNEATLRAAFHEISVLKKLDLHPLIMGLFMAFRHRQYIGFLRPAFFTLRDKIDIMHKFKKSGDSKQVFFRHPYMSKDWAASFSESYAKECLKKPGVFGRDAVAYTVTHVIAALEFLNSKNLVHTNISSASVFVNERSFIKLGSFLHVRRIGSLRWDFTGNPGILPPEAFQEFTQKRKLRIKPNFDTWAIGLFVLEMIIGKRMHYSRAEMAEVANKFFDGTLPTPTLEETDPNTVVNGMQIYDPDITDFLAMYFALCFALNCETRAEPSHLLKYKFLNRTIDTEKAQYNLAVESQVTIAWNTERSLRLEMLTVHTYYAQLKEDLMQQICTAIRLVREQAGIPIFDENLDKGLARNEYVVVEASLAFILDEDQQDRSTDVLDVSNATTPGRMQLPQHQENKTPSAFGEQIRHRRNFNNKMERDYQRCELIFFVKRKWSKANRQLFIALMFARWFDRDLISFLDLIRVVDELDDILTNLMLFSEPRPLSPYKHQSRTAKPDSVAFVTGLRRSLIDPESKDDPDTHRYNNIYVEVALNSKLVKDKKIKMHRLRKGDPVNYPDSVQPLYAAATFYELNIQRLNTLDAVLLGERRVKEWEYLPDERILNILNNRNRRC